MSPPPRDQFVSTVLANIPLCREHFRLVLGLPGFPPTDPGQFVQLACRDTEITVDDDREIDWAEGRPITLAGHELRAPLALLRRPFSLAGRRDTAAGDVELDVIHRVVGVGTDWLSRLGPGDRVGVLGPLGNRFSLPPEEGLALLVGGGVGIPPMIYLAEALFRARGLKAHAFVGAVSRDLLPLTIRGSMPGVDVNDAGPHFDVEEFSRYNIGTAVSTDDGSFGFRGFVTQALERYLDEWFPAERRTLPPRPIIYTCGPELMMKRVAEIARARGLECQVAVERAMACGMGTCQSCCIRVRKPDPAAPPLPGRDWCYRLACTDGPVFRGAELLW